MAGWSMVANLTGPQGPTGSQGPQGDTGPQGPQGEDGAGIEISGSAATYAALPTTLTVDDAGNGYLNQADGKLYIWDGDSFPAEGSGVEFRGPQGVQGPKGDQGDVGPDGPQGIQGTTGLQGIQGVQGDVGPPGPKGDQGDEGPQGIQGVQGATGATGAQGDTGPQGTTGSTGPQGFGWGAPTSGMPSSAPSDAGVFRLDPTTGIVYYWTA